MKLLIVEKEFENIRINKYLQKILCNAPSSFIYKMFRKKNILLNDKKISGNEYLKGGEKISIFFKDDTYELFTKKINENNNYEDNIADNYIEKLEKNIIYEDNNIMIIDKWENIKSQKDKKDDISLNEICRQYMKLKKENNENASIVNRLDTNTKGLIIFAKNYMSKREITEAVKEKRIIKTYLALLNGRLFENSNVILYMKKDEKNNKVEVSKENHEGYYYTETEYEIIKNYTEFTLVKVNLKTGKSHQIRAMFKFLGCPIVCDKKYLTYDKYKENVKMFQTKSQLLISSNLYIKNIKSEQLKYLENKEFNSKYKINLEVINE